MTLVEFLTARLDEDEVAAREAGPELEVAAHWYGAHDAARVLREVEAKRSIVALAILPDHQSFTSPWVDALLALAAVYSTHPDYREEWRP